MRTLVAAIDREIVLVPGTGLSADWRRLVALLALGPEPERRTCPVCGHEGMRAATRCGYCWTKLPPAAGGLRVAVERAAER